MLVLFFAIWARCHIIMLPKMNGTFAPATVSAAEVDFLDLLEKEEADFADQGGNSVVCRVLHII